MMKLVLMTGMTGAGKSHALKTLEGLGYETLDNIPPVFLQAIAGSAAQRRSLAVGVDACSDGFSVQEFLKFVEPLRTNPGLEFRMAFLDSDDDVLARRLADAGRSHPLLPDRKVADGIRHERQLIGALRDAADMVIDTSDYEGMELRSFIASHFSREKKQRSLVVTSFSFKRGVPREADFLFDVRFLKNPHYEPDLKALTGTDGKVGAHIETDADFEVFYERVLGVMNVAIPRHMQRENPTRHFITVAFGCTGGRHRSVYVAEKFSAAMMKQGFEVTTRHRDIL